MGKIGISDFVDTLLLGNQMFRTLGNVEPINDYRGLPQFTAGRQGPIFAIRIDGVRYALKCYSTPATPLLPLHTLLQELRSPLIVAPTLLPEELWVGSRYADVALYPWVEGHSLEWKTKQALHNNDPESLALLAHNFTNLASQLLDQEWRHGDLKAENIIVTPTGQMKLIDCDSIYHPSLQWQGQMGTTPYVHPKRQKAYDPHIDDFSIALIISSLNALQSQLSLYCGDTMVALPALGNGPRIAELFAHSAELLHLLEALHLDDYKIPNLNHTLKCILHK